MDTSCTQVRFPRDSNIRYLPLVYLIPSDQIKSYPALNTIPRCLSENRSLCTSDGPHRQ